MTRGCSRPNLPPTADVARSFSYSPPDPVSPVARIINGLGPSLCAKYTRAPRSARVIVLYVQPSHIDNFPGFPVSEPPRPPPVAGTFPIQRRKASGDRPRVLQGRVVVC